MPKTLCDKYISVLTTEMDFCVVVSRSRKYTKLHNPKTNQNIFVGKAGAIRAGRSSSESFPVDQSFKDKLLKIYDLRTKQERRTRRGIDSAADTFE